MDTIYSCSMSAGFGFAAVLPPPPPFFDDGRSLYFTVYVNFVRKFPTNHRPNPSLSPQILGGLHVPRHAFLAAPVAVTLKILSAIGVALPPGLLDPFAPRMSSFAAATSAKYRVLPLCVHLVAVSHPLIFYQPYPLIFYPDHRHGPGSTSLGTRYPNSDRRGGDDEEGDSDDHTTVDFLESSTEDKSFFEENFSSAESEEDEDEEDEEDAEINGAKFDLLEPLTESTTYQETQSKVFFEEDFPFAGSNEDEDEEEEEEEDQINDTHVDLLELLAESTADQATDIKAFFEDDLSSPESDEDEDEDEEEDEINDTTVDSSKSLAESTADHEAAESKVLFEDDLSSLESDEDEDGEEEEDEEEEEEEGEIEGYGDEEPSIFNTDRSSTTAQTHNDGVLDGGDGGGGGGLGTDDPYSLNTLFRWLGSVGLGIITSAGGHSDQTTAFRDSVDDYTSSIGSLLLDTSPLMPRQSPPIDRNDLYFDDDDDTSSDEDLNVDEFMLGVVPATMSSIEALEEVTSRKDDRCVICLEDFSSVIESNGHDYLGDDNNDDDDDDEVVVVRMPCSHLFHKECIVQWLEKSHLCPLCRFSMPTCDITSTLEFWETSNAI